MGCHTIHNGIICLPNIYKYKGFTFEWHSYLGPMKLRKDFEPCNKQGKKFYDVVSEWQRLSKTKQEKTKVYG